MAPEPECWLGCFKVRVSVGMLQSPRVSQDVSQDKTIDDGKDKSIELVDEVFSPCLIELPSDRLRSHRP